jgi:hypothetical protein
MSHLLQRLSEDEDVVVEAIEVLEEELAVVGWLAQLVLL